ncbi:MAG: S-methyl-5-thioribose-1-phosphate isomerase [Deltaproteobacteria bacterium]|nr:MAG: S-methyl-5-thioribose-1-phosphate isomerase [Deltaproteobacteria bacterium]
MLTPVDWKEGRLRLIAQTRLPAEFAWIEPKDVEEVARAIEVLDVRGAPAIGIAAAFGLVIAANAYGGDDAAGCLAAVESAAERLAATRPTAVNLFWALERMKKVARGLQAATAAGIRAALLEEAQKIRAEDIESCRRMGRYGAELLPDPCTVLTHCNAGALATGGYGTALGVIRAAVEAGKKVRVLADETRPLLQGARLTAWELMQDGIDVTLICDDMAGALMSQGLVHACVVGADRIARNGDTANKIGTYTVAVLARHHGIPFYVAAPTSTVDLSLSSGKEIPIEERAAGEVTEPRGVRIAPEGVKVRNPAFDVTPAGLITAIITEQGVARGPDFAPELERMVGLAKNGG